MPLNNRFPDSIEKRELRRRDRRLLEAFKLHHGLERGLSYCGMPSVEFLDVQEWKHLLAEVTAIELDRDSYTDMRIQWANLGLPIRIAFELKNIYDYLRDTDFAFDVYNLDFFGGFLNLKSQGSANATESLRALLHRHGKTKKSFVLIATFNVRENAAKEYSKLLDGVRSALATFDNVDVNCKEHERKAYYKTKLGFQYFCWDVGRANGFSVNFGDIYLYQSSVPLLHFWCEFSYQHQALPDVPAMTELALLANRPLKRIEGLVSRTIFQPTQIAS